jgi:hypothetical protein
VGILVKKLLLIKPERNFNAMNNVGSGIVAGKLNSPFLERLLLGEKPATLMREKGL